MVAPAYERAVDIASFIGQDRPNTSVDWLIAIFGSVRRLEHFPESGRRVPESGQRDLREVIHGNYRIIYRLRTDDILILTVRHARQHLRTDDPDLA